MNFSEILRSSFTLTLRHRWMWLVGFLLAPSLLGESPFELDVIAGELPAFPVLFAAMAYGLIVPFVMLVASVLVNPALIIGAARSHRGQSAAPLECLRLGLEFFSRWAPLLLIWIAIGAATTIFLVMPIVIAFVVNRLLGWVVLVLFLPVFFAAMVVIGAVWQYSFRCLIFQQSPVSESIPRGFALFKRKLWPSCAIVLVGLVIGLILTFPISFAVMIPQQSIEAMFGEGILGRFLKYGLALLISIPLCGYISAWNNNLWTIAFLEWFQTPEVADNQSVVQEQ